MPVLSQHYTHHNCMRQSYFPFKWNVTIMEPVNRWKCCTLLNFSSGMCVCASEALWHAGAYVSVAPSRERCPSCSIIFSFDSHYSLSLTIWKAKQAKEERRDEVSLNLCLQTLQINSSYQSNKPRTRQSLMFQCDAIIHQFTWGSSFTI